MIQPLKFLSTPMSSFVSYMSDGGEGAVRRVRLSSTPLGGCRLRRRCAGRFEIQVFAAGLGLWNLNFVARAHVTNSALQRREDGLIRLLGRGRRRGGGRLGLTCRYGNGRRGRGLGRGHLHRAARVTIVAGREADMFASCTLTHKANISIYRRVHVAVLTLTKIGLQHLEVLTKY